MTNETQPDINVTWSAATTSTPTYRMVPMRLVGDPEVPILSVKMSADARIAAVQRLLPDGRLGYLSVECFSLSDWSFLWRIELPFQYGGNVAHPVQPLFLEANRLVIAGEELAMYDEDRLLWRTEYPLPDLASPSYYIAREPQRWRVVDTSAPIVWNELFLIHVHWARWLGPGGDNEGVWQDIFSFEVVDADGRWLRRIDVDDERVPSEPVPVIRDAFKQLSDGAAEWQPDGVVVAFLRPPQGRWISNADISIEHQRALVVLNARELVDYSLQPC